MNSTEEVHNKKSEKLLARLDSILKSPQIVIKDSIRSEAFRSIGDIKAKQGFFEEAETYLKEALLSANRTNKPSLKVKALGRLADNHLNMNRHDKAVELDLKALQVAEKEKDDYLMALAKSSLAETYRHAAKMKLAERYNLQAIEHYKAVENWNQVARCYNNFAATIGKAGRNQEAIDTLKVALSFIEEDNLFARAKHFSNIGYCFRNMQHYDSALYYNKKSLKLKQQINDSWGIGYSLGAIGRCYIGLEQFDSAIHYTKQSYDTTVKYKNLYRIKDAAQYVSDAYRAAGDYKKALHFSDINRQFDDSIFVEETSNKIELLQRKYDISKKEAEIERLKSQQELEQANQKTIVAILIGFLLLLIVVALFFRLRAIKRAEEKKIIEIELANSKKQLQSRRFELENYVRELLEKNKTIKQFQLKMIDKEEELEKYRNQKSDELEKLADLKILTDDDWKRFKLLFDRVHPEFFERLNRSTFDFTKGEKRLLALTKLDMSHGEIADTLGISTESVTKSRFRLKKKLIAEGIENIEDYLASL
ncbi:MAG: tetratricopeptide repeat protein [Vicingaceae bacterium]